MKHSILSALTIPLVTPCLTLCRNFPEVTLYPDITKLSETDSHGNPKPVVDVYGRLQNIPAGNLFVAGTSCKDFSMLKTTLRKDIEDKGQSGQTFLAAVEFLDLYKPPFAIFENVDGAPWEKMQMYIEGRIDLASRNDDKGISVDKKKKQSKFIVVGSSLPTYSLFSSISVVSRVQRLR
jgi:hypothetical protein